MKKTMSSNPVLNVFTLLIAAAPMLDMSTRSSWGHGETDYPEEESFN